MNNNPKSGTIVESPPTTHQLKFTGSCSEQEFLAQVAKHDWWYHSFYFDNGFQVSGDYNIGRNIDEYGFPADMSGMRVLDVGSASGWFSFFLEQRGADVTAFDTRGWSDFDLYGHSELESIEDEKPVADVVQDGTPIYLGPVSAGLWIMKGILDSRVRLVGGSVYDIGREHLVGEKFDLVFLGAMLLHVRDPIGALMATRRVCKGQAIATTALARDDSGSGVPWMMLPATNTLVNAWWQPNLDCCHKWFAAAGYRSIERSHDVDLYADKVTPEHHNNDQTVRLVCASI